MVADILMLKQVLLDREAKALLVLPYVALVQEKVRWLRNIVQGISRSDAGDQVSDGEHGPWRKRADADTVRVVPFFGGSKIRPTWVDFDIGVCTFEKVRGISLFFLSFLSNQGKRSHKLTDSFHRKTLS